jgi:DNA end-binding protein Ku
MVRTSPSNNSRQGKPCGRRAAPWSKPRPTGRCSTRDLVKDCEFAKGRYLLLTDEELDRVKVESCSVMNIEKFVAVDSINPTCYASSYYLARIRTSSI